LPAFVVEGQLVGTEEFPLNFLLFGIYIKKIIVSKGENYIETDKRGGRKIIGVR
jgi:hypothetical protein